MEPQPRIGVYICHCGTNIAANVDVEQVAEFAATLPGVAVSRDYLYMCSDPGQALIRRDIKEQELNRVVVASCSPRMHEPTFRGAAQQAGLNPYRVEMANIREQCSWVHTDRGEATEKAKSLVASAVAKVDLLAPLEEREVEVTPGAVVIGGGIAGMSAALEVADAGFPVYLVEKSDHLGGRVADLNYVFPTLEPVPELLEPLIGRIQTHPNITVFLNAQVAEVEGFVGNFEVKVQENKEAIRNLQVGSIIIATGYDVFDPHRKPELGYGQYPNVITSLEMEQRLAEASTGSSGRCGLTVNGRSPQSVAFIQCVGSRDAQVGHLYCSRVCCMYTAKQARLVRELVPDANVTVFFIDVRTFGKGAEEFYDEVRAKQVRYRRGNVSEIYRRGDCVVLVAEDTLLGRPIEFEADLVVLAVGMEPRSDVAACLPGGLLSGSQGYPRHHRAGQGGGLVGPHSSHQRHGAGNLGDSSGGRGRVRRVWDVRGGVSLWRAGPPQIGGRLTHQRSAVQRVRGVRDGLSLQGHPLAALYRRAGLGKSFLCLRSSDPC